MLIQPSSTSLWQTGTTKKEVFIIWAFQCSTILQLSSIFYDPNEARPNNHSTNETGKLRRRDNELTIEVILTMLFAGCN